MLLRELGYLVHFCNDSDSAKKINVIYDNIKQNCSSDKIRISATRHIIYYYADLANCNNSSVSFADVESLLKDMPYMRDGQEFISSYLYPAELAKEFDGLDRITIMHSSLFDGKKFDKHKLGSTYSACSDLKNFLEQYSLSDAFKNSKEFREIVNNLN